MINAHNHQMNANNPDDLILAPNFTADWTNTEYVATLTMPSEIVDQVSSDEPEGTRRRRLSNEPRKVDHAEDGFMIDVKDQSGCGACWAFAANSCLEGTLAKKTGQAPIHISE